MKGNDNDLMRQRYLRNGKDSFILGLFGLLLHLLAFLDTDHFILFQFITLFFGITGLVLGIISRKTLKENNKFGLAGLIVSSLTLIGCALAIVFFVISLSHISDYFYALASNPW